MPRRSISTNKGKGRYRPAPAETLAAAKAGLEKKRLAAERQAHLAAELAAFRLPPEYASLIPRILIAPDKNTLEYKALEDAAAATGLSQLRLIERCGAIPSTLDFHLATFLLEYFPRGTGFAEVTEPAALNPSDPPALPKSPVRAFSMDDEATTEIDDALSVQWLDDRVRVGIHIAAPALGIAPGSALDQVARERLSTVYIPGDKITMLPDALIHHYTLARRTTARRCRCTWTWRPICGYSPPKPGSRGCTSPTTCATRRWKRCSTTTP